MNDLHTNNHYTKMCPNGYFGLNSDPYDCTAYYVCPHKIQMFCELNYEFDLNTASCVPIIYDNKNVGCTARLYNNLLL